MYKNFLSLFLSLGIFENYVTYLEGEKIQLEKYNKLILIFAAMLLGKINDDDKLTMTKYFGIEVNLT